MLTSEDIRKLMEVLAAKDDVQDLKQDVHGLRVSIQVLTVSVDRLAGTGKEVKL